MKEHHKHVAKRTLYTIVHCTILDFVIQGPVRAIEAALHWIAAAPVLMGVQASMVIFLIVLIHFEEHLGG